MSLETEIKRRRTFAIISHPDAGKTTLTEKFLLYGGAIAQAGAVKGKKAARHATSDWMEIEKQRGISVTSSVMQFQYDGFCVNILDTPGHQDFSEDTYRTLMAADSAVMVIDASKGVEEQTRKLFKVCTMRGIPIFTFINKMDREARDPFELCQEIEAELGIDTYAMNWPVGCGKEFQGVYDRARTKLIHFQSRGNAKTAAATEVNLEDEQLEALIGSTFAQTLRDEVELLDGASCEFDLARVRQGKLSPVFFGSALTNFGVEPFLEEFLRLTPPPAGRLAGESVVDAFDEGFSAFVFKIQANMNKAHRDRIAFLRVCSGRFDKDGEYLHVQGGKRLRLSRPQQMMAQEREMIDEAYAGDIIGVFDSGIFAIGDTVCDAKTPVRFDPIPTFAPEQFMRVRSRDTMKRKQFTKGITQIAQEGAIQMFRSPYSGMEEVIVGAVGPLQFDVLEHRLRGEYNVELIMEGLPYRFVRWIEGEPVSEQDLTLGSDTRLVEDFKGRQLLLFGAQWSIQWVRERNKHLVLREA